MNPRNLPIVLELWRLLPRLRQRDHWTRVRLAMHQADALRALREYAYVRSPFYQRFHQGLTERPLEELPVLTKAVLMEHFDELVTDRAVQLAAVEAHVAGLRDDERFLGRYWANATSGSTGRRGMFLFDRSEWLRILASVARAHDWAGVHVGVTHRMRLAEVASTAPWHLSTRVGVTLDSPWVPALRLPASEPLDVLVQRLNGWRPEMLVAYSSQAHALAEAQLAGDLRVAPRLVFTSAEVLTEGMRQRIEAAWGQVLFNQYAATEVGGLAAECEQHRGLHLQEDLVITEVVDRDNRPVPPGTYGDKLLVTVLARRTQPLIRYEISDSVRLAAAPCPCGRPFALIDGIQGRAEDVLYFPTPGGARVAVQPLVFHRVMDTVPAAGWQVVQEPDGLRVLVSAARDESVLATLADALRQALAAQGVTVPPVQVLPVVDIPRSANGKTPLIKSNLPRT